MPQDIGWNTDGRSSGDALLGVLAIWKRLRELLVH